MSEHLRAAISLPHRLPFLSAFALCVVLATATLIPTGLPWR